MNYDFRCRFRFRNMDREELKKTPLSQINSDTTTPSKLFKQNTVRLSIRMVTFRSGFFSCNISERNLII